MSELKETIIAEGEQRIEEYSLKCRQYHSEGNDKMAWKFLSKWRALHDFLDFIRERQPND